MADEETQAVAPTPDPAATLVTPVETPEQKSARAAQHRVDRHQAIHGDHHQDHRDPAKRTGA